MGRAERIHDLVVGRFTFVVVRLHRRRRSKTKRGRPDMSHVPQPPTHNGPDAKSSVPRIPVVGQRRPSNAPVLAGPRRVSTAVIITPIISINKRRPS